MDFKKYLSQFYGGTKGPTLNAIKFFMEEFGHPERKLNVIHVAGTNGKGSCVETITNILINADYNVGKFISPHLVKYNERISINNQSITDVEIEKLIEKLEPKIKKYNSANDVEVTLFELETTMALLYFYEHECDFVVLETGLGGLCDCTNIVEKPIVSIITSVGYDHMNILGNTLVEIAKQKAGIIKENSDTIFIEQDEDVNSVIRQSCKEKSNSLHLIKLTDISNYSFDQNFQIFDYKNYKNVCTNLKGEKQIYNSSISIECIEILRSKGYTISDEALREGLKTVVHRGRLEVINEKPLMIYDGAHNEPAIDNFINSVNMYYKNHKKIYIISILKYKDYNIVLKKLLQDDDAIFIFTDGNGESRFLQKEELLKIAKKHTSNNKLYTYDLLEAIDLVKENYKDYTIFLVGSFYIYGTVMDKLKEDVDDKI